MDEQTQALFHDMISRCLAQEVAPFYDQWEADGEIPRSLWLALGAAGLLGIDLDETYGGSGADIAITQLVLEEMSRQGFGGLASAYNIHANIVMPYLQNLATDEQRETWLPRMASGEWLGAIAMSEPHAGSDLAAMKTRATKTADGWTLNGSKLFITNGQVADLVIVCAKTDPSAGAKGVSLFLVDTSLAGFSRGKPIKKIGQHASDTAELAFDQLQLPNSALLGEEGAGFRYLMQELPRERLGVGAQALGAVEGALALTLDYVTQRHAFGQRVADFQNTRFTLAEIKAQLDVARAYFDQCVNKYRHGTMTSTEAAILKLQLSELQCRAVDRCLQLFGGYGYTHEYPISRFYLDARVQTIYAGSSEIMKEVVARSLLGKVA
ncbi:acyl-CoA dehydrogenase family protein [Vreelandella venusta]|uniref:Acyl-CoA dehydrogenase n=1 Tax=Vreelandella venusta TaxID=44935 RepID=A0AAP9ZGJ8_9GAMM|nr:MULTISPECIES: acyl-CoA dehydrogenase family protein [Halomonas]MBR9926872.1 acyl-CoA dehydrogenase [Gammaproteobacteria bacterium]AZM95426.1 acyl-CoA dehydrogenase [Halomonas venusta]MDW0361407.1 acyl-CoA dehydrogenase family protein [Halomonas venusta]MDX1713904.1 acyl-CoA dehydrogenase family protein [Halomonas venusta]NPT32757.1 acyl-CoA dehydrogenase [Halomonas venusta]